MFHNAQISGNSDVEPHPINLARTSNALEPYRAPRAGHQLAAALVLVVLVALLTLL
jgi:hypothetical protein